MNSKEKAITERFSAAVDWVISNKKEKWKASIAEKLGMTPSNFSEILHFRICVSTEVLADFCVLYNVNPIWILTGTGSLYYRFDSGIESVTLKDGNVNYKRNIEAGEKILERQILPVYNMHAGGLLSLFNHPDMYEPTDYISIPDIGLSDGAMLTFGDSMYPLIKPGDIIVYRQLKDILNNIFWGELYLLSYDLEGEEYIVTKYIHKSDVEGCIKLVSHNPNHLPKDIPISKINALAQIKASVRFFSTGRSN